MTVAFASVTRVLLCVLFAMVPRAQASDQDNEQDDMACGPRCVQRILLHYGKPEIFLTDLIKEMQGTMSTRGVSFRDIKEAIERRGLHCQLVQTPWYVVPSWPEPVVLHVDGNHFVVLESRTWRRAEVWWGLAGTRSERTSHLWRRMSDVALLVSAKPIAQDAVFASPLPSRIAAAVLLLTAAVVGARALRRLRSIYRGQSLLPRRDR